MPARLTALLILLAGACAPDSRPPSGGARGEAKPIAGLFAVDWKDGTTKAQFDAEEKALGIDLELNSPEAADEALTVARGVANADEVLAKLRGNPLVEHAEPVFEVRAFFEPNDPNFRNQWHLAQVGAASAWEWGAGSEVVVAVIDTGVARLEDLKGTRFVAGFDFVNDDKDADDDNGHGSHVAGTIAQTTHNGEGVAGLAHRAAIMPVKVLSAEGFGTTVDIADAIRFAVDNGAKVLNLSLGGGGESAILRDAVAYARRKGAFVACAAGNGFGPPVGYPAAYPGAFAVSAIRFDRALAPYSSFGPEVDLAAPGGDKSVDQNGDGQPDGVLQQTIGGRYEWFQGTSMATPHVAGAAALLAGAGVTDVDAIERLLKATAVPLGTPEKFGAGALDAGAAMRHVRLWGGLWRIAIAMFFAWIATRMVRRREGSVVPLGVSGLIALVVAAGGVMLLPLVGFGHPAFAAFLSQPMPEWGEIVDGATRSNPLWLSAFVPFLALGFSRLGRLAPIGAGIALGFAGYLAHGAVVGWADVAWVPGRALEAVWLGGNALLSAGFGALALRPR